MNDKIEEIIQKSEKRGFFISKEFVEDLLTLHCGGSFVKLEDRLEKIFEEYSESFRKD